VSLIVETEMTIKVSERLWSQLRKWRGHLGKAGNPPGSAKDGQRHLMSIFRVVRGKRTIRRNAEKVGSER